MSKRLQVLFDEAELRDIGEAAGRQGMPVSEWVRRALREARRREPRGTVDTKLGALRAAVRHEFPTADIDEMLGDIGRGYGARTPE